MKYILKILINAVVVFSIAYFLDGITINSYLTAILVALVLSILNFLVRPILVFLTLPVTILTLGLFLLVINTFIIQIADYFVDGFSVNGFWMALLFSILLSVVQSLTYRILSTDEK